MTGRAASKARPGESVGIIAPDISAELGKRSAAMALGFAGWGHRATGTFPPCEKGARLSAVIDDFLRWEDWDNPHPDMDISESFGAILGELGDLVEGLAGARPDEASADMARLVLVRTPALVNVLLNYKICAEHGLPFHPTVYYELEEARKYRIPHPLDLIEEANRLFRQAIGLARAAYRLDPGFPAGVRAFRGAMPPELEGFLYTGARDTYTWRGSDPGLVRRLADLVLGGRLPDVIVAAAHGSIMPALLLAEYLGTPLYFLRFSMFKRNDDRPIVSIADEAWLAAWDRGQALLFDEDVAGGRTLAIFRERLSPLFAKVETACIIRHAGAIIKPDYTGRIWYD